MQAPLLYDAVTLRHFALVDRLDVCESSSRDLSGPRWTEAVHGEIERHANKGSAECTRVLASAWLSHPIAPSTAELIHIAKLQTALGGLGRLAGDDEGEAESIYFAEKHGGSFATDDGSAFDFAARRLGAERVIDSVDILRRAVRAGEVTQGDALTIATSIRAAGGHLRRVHPATLTAEYFG
jgi:hypothetical protein